MRRPWPTVGVGGGAVAPKTNNERKKGRNKQTFFRINFYITKLDVWASQLYEV